MWTDLYEMLDEMYGVIYHWQWLCLLRRWIPSSLWRSTIMGECHHRASSRVVRVEDRIQHFWLSSPVPSGLILQIFSYQPLPVHSRQILPHPLSRRSQPKRRSLIAPDSHSGSPGFDIFFFLVSCYLTCPTPYESNICVFRFLEHRFIPQGDYPTWLFTWI